MSIVALTSQDRAAPVQAALIPMQAALLAQTPGLEVCEQVLPGAAFSGLARSGRCPYAQSGQTRLWVDGEIFEDDFRQARQLPQALSLAEWLLQRYRTAGAAGLQNLNGLYCILIWDENRRRLEIINDRYGIARLYLWQSPDGLVASSRLQAIAAHPQFRPVLDEAALSDFLCVDHLLEDRTFLKDVRVLPAASYITWQDGQVEEMRYWRLPVSGSLVIDGREAAGRFHDLLLQAVRRRADGPVRLLLTGGIDSRLLAGALYRSQAEVEALTLGQSRSFEAQTASEVARLLNIPHSIQPIPPNYVERFAHATVRHTEGNMNVHAGWIMAAEQFIGHNADGVIISGVGGELISGRYWLTERNPADRREALQEFCHRKWDFNLPEKLLRADVANRVAGVSKQAIQRWLYQSSDAPLNSVIEEMYLQTHYRRHATGRDVFPESVIADPFYDNDLVDFTLSLPMELRLGGKLFHRTLLQHYPQLAQLPHNARGARLTDRPIDLRRRYAQRLTLRALRKLTGINLLPKAAENISYNHWMRTESRDYTQGVVNKSALLCQYLDIEAAQRMVEEHLSGRSLAYRQICALITIEQVMQTFLQPVPSVQSIAQESWQPALASP